MEYYEPTLDRAQKTLALWNSLLPELKIGTLGAADLGTWIGGFEPLIQQRTAKQDDADEGFRDVQGTLLTLKVLGTKIPKIIEGHLEEDERLMKAVDDLYRVNPRTESTILKRGRELVSVWEWANTAMAAMTPAQPPITRSIGGVVHTVAMLKALLDGYAGQITVLETRESALDAAREALRVLDRQTDRLNKRWYKVVKESHDEGDAVSEALSGIPVETGTPAPDPIEIETVGQGGEEGLQVLVQYVPGGGDHATTKLVQWQVVGVGAPGSFPNTRPLDPSGNTLGPFTVGQTVKVRTAVSNSSGVRTTAARTITVAVPIV